MEYVIGIASKPDGTTAAAMSLSGDVLAFSQGGSCSYVTTSRRILGKRCSDLITKLLSSFHGRLEDCRCMLVGAAGIDSPKTKQIFVESFALPHMLCPVICLNDGMVALYTVTKGLGVLSVADRGSIAVGRNSQGKITRSGGYPITILGNEGSAQWIALNAMRHASLWLDGSMEKTPLIDKMEDHFHGLDIEKLTESANALRRRTIDTGLADLVMAAAQEGDTAAAQILRRGAGELFQVADSCVRKLGFQNEEHFLSGIWGSVFKHSEIYRSEYTRLFLKHYPNSSLVVPERDEAEGAALMALDYLADKIPYLSSL